MGNNESLDLEVKPQDIVQLNMPIPDLGVVEKKFSLVLNSMNLPPDKTRLLCQYDSLKKWDLICDQERFQVKNQPQTYICKLQGYLDHGVTQKKFLQRVQESMKVLQDLEISLRTNHIGWVREFLNNENKGLCVLVEYLCFARRAVLCSSFTNSKTVNNSRLVSQTDDVHICVMCLRAVMNYQYGFNLVMSHPHAVNEIALSLNNKNSRTKTLVLELLAAVCLVRGGHEITLSAFDNFKEVCKENHRFEKLMEYFRCEDENMDFMVACMQFINIIVHSVEDMNFRVHLQYEFTKLGLDAFLEKCRHMESEKLLVQIQTYLDNLLDVGGILKDAKAKNMALEKIEELEDQLSRVTERLLGVENDAMMKVAELEKKVFKKDQDLFTIKETFNPTSSQIHTLHRLIQAKDDTYQREFNSKKELQDLEQQGPIHLQQPKERVAVKALCPAYGGDIPVPPPLPVAPPLPGTSQSVILSVGLSAMRIKKPIKTKFRLPVFNWTALKPNQINGTVFNEIDDEKVLEELDLDKFEELFKTKAQGPVMDLSSPKAKGSQKAINRFTLLDVNRSKNLAITLRKANKSTEEICKAIQMFDLEALPVDFVECLLRFLPTEAETRLLRQYEHDGQPLDHLAKEDHFMLNFGKIERLSQRITIIIFVGNFADSVNMLMPQLNAIIAASTSVKSSPKLKRMLEIILALGNYMNSSTRGSVYGFKLQSLDLLLDTKSTDRKMSLFHYIAMIVKKKYPELASFSSELHLVDKAAAVSLENVLLDVLELGKGMELVCRECCLQDHAVLKNFLQTSNPQLEKLQKDAKTAEEAFDNVVLYFGENPKTMPPSVFFSVFVRFIKAYEDAVEDNGQRKKQEKAMQFVQDVRKQDPKVNSKQQSGIQIEAIIGILETQTQRKRHLQRHEHIAELRRQPPTNRRPVYEGKDGTIGDILTDLWNQPFQRTDAVKRLGL